MFRALILGTAILLSGCAAFVPAAILAVEAISQAAEVTEATCKVGEDLTTAQPAVLSGHPTLQTATKVCEALAP